MNLKRCPFCGESVYLHIDETIRCYEVICRGCGTVTSQFYGVRDEAARAWNRRVGDDLKERMEDDCR